MAASGTAPAPASGNFAYGFQAHMWDLGAQAKGFVVGDVKQAGFNWIKHQIEWTTIETAAGKYDWTEMDNIINADAGAGLNVMVSVQHAPEFLRGPASGLMPADPSTYQKLMQAMASRYAGKIKHTSCGTKRTWRARRGRQRRPVNVPAAVEGGLHRHQSG